jgi:hypothetical protein
MSVFVNKSFSTSCPNALLDAINAESNIGPECFQMITLGNSGNVQFEFASSLSTAENNALDSLLSSWVCPTPPMIDIDNTGQIFVLQFNRSTGNMGNSWFVFGNNGNASDRVWAGIPFDCSLIGISFSNQNANINGDVRVIKLSPNQNPNQSQVVYTMENRGIRARQINFGDQTPAQFSAGDFVGLYHNNVSGGNNVVQPVVILYFVINTIEEIDVSYDISGNLSNN